MALLMTWSFFYSLIKCGDNPHIRAPTILLFIWIFGFDVIELWSPIFPPFPFQSIGC